MLKGISRQPHAAAWAAWHAIGPVPLPVQGHGPLAFPPYIALTMFSVTFLASPSSIMVLSR
ncbi:hypothetical protein M2191_008443 [Bradyrhizobium japonicum]|nr:hypothetical protein [Bradyrhizobium japonicum]